MSNTRDPGGLPGEDVLQGRDALLRTVERARLRLFCDPPDDGMVLWTWDLTQQTLDVEEAAGDFLLPPRLRRTDPSELILEVHEADRDRFVEALHAVVDGRLLCAEVEHRVRSADGAWRAVVTRAVGVKDLVGRGVRIVVGLTRQHQRQRHHEAQRMAHIKRLESIVGVSRVVMQAGRSLPEVIEQVASSIAQVVGGFCAVRLLSDDGRTLEAPAALAHVDPRRHMQVLEALGRPQAARGVVISQVIEQSMALQLCGEDQVSRFTRASDEAHPQLLVLVPLRTSDTTIGLLVAGREMATVLNTEDFQVLQELSDIAGRAIGHARMIARAEQLVRVAEASVANRSLPEVKDGGARAVTPEDVLCGSHGSSQARSRAFTPGSTRHQP